MAQPFVPLYLPDSLGGCAEIDTLIYNPFENLVYLYSGRSGNFGVLDAATADRRKSWTNFTGNLFTYNPNRNRMYATRRYRNLTSDTFALVYDCSTRAVIDSLFIPGPRQIFSGGISLNVPANKLFWYAGFYYDSHSLFIFDASTNEFVKRIDFDSSEGFFVYHHQTRPISYFVTGGNPSRIYVYDCINDTVVDTILAPPGWRFCAPCLIAPDSELLFVPADSDGTPRQDQIYIINCLSNQVLGTVQLPGGVEYLAYNPVNNKLYAAWYYSSSFRNTYVIDVGDARVSDSLGVFGDLFYNPNKNHLYSTTYGRPGISVFDGATNQIVAEIPSPGAGPGLMIPEINKLFLIAKAYNIVLIDCEELRVQRFFKMGYGNQNLMWQPVTNRLYVNDATGDSMTSILVVYDAHSLEPLKVVDLCGKVEPGEWFYDLCTATRENKIYLTSANSRGLYVLDGNTDSLLYLIPCEVSGHELIYSEKANRLFACPFTSFITGYLYIIDCADDRIVASIWIDEGPTDGYLNRFNELLYVTTGTRPSYFYLIDTNGTVLKHVRGLGNPVVFRNKSNIHQVYIGAHQDTCFYVFDPLVSTIIDTVPDVPVYQRFFAYYDSIDDRIYYPVDDPYRILVIDCAGNRVVDSIMMPRNDGGDRDAIFPEVGLWNPITNRLYFQGSIVDCRTNRLIEQIPILVPDRMAWNYYDNIVFVNDNRRAKVVAVKDNLIGVQDKPANETKPKMVLISPSVGSRFIVYQRAKGEIKIVDACGRIVKNLKPNQNSLDARNLAPGIYFATIEEHSRTLVQKFTVIR